MTATAIGVDIAVGVDRVCVGTGIEQCCCCQ